MHSFTLKRNGGLLRQLITDCEVSMPPVANNSNPEKYPFKGLWDTGATGSVITLNVVKALGIKPVGKTQVAHADGTSLQNTYLVDIFLPNGVRIKDVTVTEGRLTGFDVLIGMDIISLGDFALTNSNGNTCFSFRVPSSTEIDFVAELQKKTPVKPAVSNKVGRNAPCPCGSGQKYKRCCGA